MRTAAVLRHACRLNGAVYIPNCNYTKLYGNQPQWPKGHHLIPSLPSEVCQLHQLHPLYFKAKLKTLLNLCVRLLDIVHYNGLKIARLVDIFPT